MALQLKNVLAGIRMRGCEKKGYPFIDHVPVSIPEHRMGYGSRDRTLAQYRLGNGPSIGARYSHDPDTTTTRWCRNRTNGLDQVVPEEPTEPPAVPYFLVA